MSLCLTKTVSTLYQLPFAEPVTFFQNPFQFVKEKNCFLFTAAGQERTSSIGLTAAKCFPDLREQSRRRLTESDVTAVLFLVGPCPVGADEIEDEQRALP